MVTKWTPNANRINHNLTGIRPNGAQGSTRASPRTPVVVVAVIFAVVVVVVVVEAFVVVAVVVVVVGCCCFSAGRDVN